jgi:hypothetical protein
MRPAFAAQIARTSRSQKHVAFRRHQGKVAAKTPVYFVFIISFAMLRLWITLLVLTYGLKQSYIRAG